MRYLRCDLIWLTFIQGYLAVKIIIGFKAWTNKYNRSKGLYQELYTLVVCFTPLLLRMHLNLNHLDLMQINC